MNFNTNDTTVVVTDPQNDVLSEEGIGYKAPLISFEFIANAVLSTDAIVKAMG